MQAERGGRVRGKCERFQHVCGLLCAAERLQAPGLADERRIRVRAGCGERFKLRERLVQPPFFAQGDAEIRVGIGEVGVEGAKSTDKHGQLGRGQGQQLGFVDQKRFCRNCVG